jgi:epoxide hydrolase-like predicted phosphatase
MSDGPRGLLLDYGGVLTTPVGRSFVQWERAQGVEKGQIIKLLVGAYDDADGGLIGALERGELTAADFDEHVGRLLAEHGHEVPEGSVLTGLFAGLRPADDLWAVAVEARSAGVRTGLLSNSWGTEVYPWDRLHATFDTLVISGEVGLRKPDPAIFRLAAERLGLEVEQCAFVDDIDRNVHVAAELGMHAVHHTGDPQATRDRLKGFLGLA